jgi:hypothetical protein
LEGAPKQRESKAELRHAPNKELILLNTIVDTSVGMCGRSMLVNREKQTKRPASRNQNLVQSQIHATKQGHAMQSEARLKTPIPHTGSQAGLRLHSRVFQERQIWYTHLGEAEAGDAKELLGLEHGDRGVLQRARPSGVCNLVFFEHELALSWQQRSNKVEDDDPDDNAVNVGDWDACLEVELRERPWTASDQ